MKNKLTLIDKPLIIEKVIREMKSDSYLKTCFEGEIKEGLIIGQFTRLALLNGMVIGYTKVLGEYNLEKGELKLITKPNVLFYLLSVLVILGFTIQSYLMQLDFVLFFPFILIIAWLISSYFDGRALVLKVKSIYNSIIST